MAALFIWVFIQDKTKNNKLLEDNTTMLKVLTESNNNIAKSGEGIVRSCYEYHGGNKFYVDTCMPGGDTLLHLEGE